MKKVFIIATTFDRTNGLKTLLDSIKKYYPNWYIEIVAQGYNQELQKDIVSYLENSELKFAIHFEDKLIGAHSAKIIAIKDIEADIYCSLDDDMILTEKTNYDAIVDKLINDKYAGIITSNWVRSEKLFESKVVKDEFVCSPLVFTGGGLLFKKAIADIIVSIPNEQYEFDDCLWAMYSYVNGYDNYRYLGSVSIHNICTKGGRRTWIKAHKDRVLPPEDLLRVRRGKDSKDGYNEYLICTNSDLTDFAKTLHKSNKSNIL